MLEVRDLVIRYGSFLAVDTVSLAVGNGAIVGLIGPNGAGKSSVVRAIAGLVAPTSGAINFEGTDLANLPPHRRVEMGISLVPEGRGLFPQMSVEENLQMGGYVLPGTRVRAEIEKAYASFPILRERRGQLAGTLSGGQQQLLAMAVGVISCPKLLIIDEPSLGVAPIVIDAIGEALKTMQANGQTILLVEQNVTLAATVTDQVTIMQSGAVHHQGNTQVVIHDPEVVEKFLSA